MEESLSLQINHKTTHDISVSPILDWMDKHFNVEDITESLLELPETIAVQKGIVRKFRDTFQEADLPRKMMELEMIDDIASEKSPETGKALYSNDKLRDAELKRRKVNNPEYQDYQRQARESERELAAAEDELVRLEQRFMAYGKVSEFVAAEMNFVAGLLRVPSGIDTRLEVPEGTGTWKQPTGQPY